MDSSKSFAVVTGASSGIGFELAKQLATNDYDLLIAAEDAELQTAADESRVLGAYVEAVQIDLATDGASTSSTPASLPPDGRSTRSR